MDDTIQTAQQVDINQQPAVPAPTEVEPVTAAEQSSLTVEPTEQVAEPIPVQNDLKEKIRAVEAKGIEPKAIKEYLLANGYSEEDTALVREKWQRYEWDPDTPAEEAKDLADLYKDVYEKYSTTGKQIQGLWNLEKGIEARREVNQLNKSIVDKLQEFEYDAFVSPETGELMLRNEDGTVEEIDSSFVNRLYNTKAEIGGAIAGAWTGAKVGSKVGAGVGIAAGNMTGIGVVLPEELVTGPAGAAIGGIVGAIGGSMVGASAGKGIDMTINALQLKESIEAKMYLSQMKEAAIFDGVAGVLGTATFKLGAAGLKQIMKSFDFVARGNSKGAYKALKENLLITDDQAAEMVQQWERFNAKKAPGKSFEEKAIGVVSSTQQGAEPFVGSVASSEPMVAKAIIKDIDDRAKGLTKLIDNATGDNVGNLVREDLGKYTSEVKNFYGEVKQIGSDAINGTDFKFDLDKLALEPVMKTIEKGISNPTKREQFLSYALRIENASEGRQFGDLLELRQAINEFKYSKTGLKKPDVDALNSVINKVDVQIGKAVKDYMPENGGEWLKQFSEAKTQYSKMKKMEDNILYKALTKKGVTEDSIAAAAKKYINSIDGTFDEVLEKLPPKTRGKVESVVVRELTDRYTLGYATDQQAIHFPMLADHLKRTNLTTPEGKYLKDIVQEYGKIFKNDPNLSKVSGNIAVPKFQSYLTVDPVMRAKYEVASAGFNAVKRLVPGRKANNLALLNKMGTLLENPLNAKTADSFVKSFPREQQAEIVQLISGLRQAMAKTGQKPAAKDFKKMYKQSATGKFVVTDGKFGKGVYFVDKVKNPNATNIIGKELNLSRLATLDDISLIVGKDVTEEQVRKIPKLQQLLEEKGFEGIKTEGKAMVFKLEENRKK
jgi:hypothetical protein